MGIKPLPEALQLARELDLDLVEVAPMANPPVCKILDYGKWKYEAAQRDKESRRKTTNISIKEMKYRPKIGQGDFDTKTRQVSRFLDEGHKVKITIMFRGREVAHPELGKKILDRIAEGMGPTAKVEAAPKLDGRNMVMVLAPDKRAQALLAKEAAKEAKAGDGAAAGDGGGTDGDAVVDGGATNGAAADGPAGDAGTTGTTEESTSDAQDAHTPGSGEALQGDGDRQDHAAQGVPGSHAREEVIGADPAAGSVG
jgi:translation initiation factor IF-3